MISFNITATQLKKTHYVGLKEKFISCFETVLEIEDYYVEFPVPDLAPPPPPYFG